MDTVSTVHWNPFISALSHITERLRELGNNILARLKSAGREWCMTVIPDTGKAEAGG